MTSSTTTFVPLSAMSFTTCPPIPPAPPVITTISFSQSYLSCVQLLSTFWSKYPLIKRITPKMKSVRSREKAVGWRMERSEPFLVYRARAMKRSVKKGFRAVRLRKVPMGSEVRPVEGGSW
jgi:hypothetical protein